jgi:hypothetical protein
MMRPIIDSGPHACPEAPGVVDWAAHLSGVDGGFPGVLRF